MAPSEEARHIIWADCVDSTNAELRRRLTGIDNLSTLAAREQTAGRGQGDHTWYSPVGEGLTFSVLYRYGQDGPEASQALCVTCATTLAIRDYLAGKGVEARIKWPNDIWVGERKICGILIENSLEDRRLKESIVGIGLNLNCTSWPACLPNPVSLRELTGQTYEPGKELVLLHNEIRRRRAMMDSDDGRISLQEEFRKYMFRPDEEPRP